MKFRETEFKGAFIIEPEKIEDERGFFARTWCQREFEKHGLKSRLVQCSISRSKMKGTLRGMHYQLQPYAEDKLVRCTKGSIHDVIIDLRPDSESFQHHLSLTLSSEDHRMLYIPKGCAHGFQTLEDDTEVFYQMSDFYHPEAARGIRWNDPAFSIEWPYQNHLIISDKDKNWPVFSE